MATIQERNQSYPILFLYHGKRYTLKLGSHLRQKPHLVRSFFAQARLKI